MDMLSEVELRNDYRKYFTLSTVGLGHLLVLYAIWNVGIQAPMVTDMPKNTINIRFLAPQKNDVQPVADAVPKQIFPTDTQKNALVAESVPVSHAVKKQDSKISVISTDAVQKTAVPMQKNESKQQTQQRNAVQLEKAAVDINSDAKKKTLMSAPSMSVSTAEKSVKSAESDTKGMTSNSERQSESSLNAAASDKAPTPISWVDVLSLGKLTYDDRELQNQQRLVVLTIHINAKGQPLNIRVKQSSGINSLDERAVSAIQKSKFKPHKMDGEAVAVIVDFPIQLKLSRNR